jgi:class 3 adenylate cyclase/tetratricopeptide (TPR) repeat protein
MICPACGAAVPDAARFCPECGQRLVAAPDERRLVTVLMADLVGFTAYSESVDPEQVKRVVDVCFERLTVDVTTFGGRLDKIVGDELVALFGAPVAHEDDAERAVRAALRMQESLTAVATEIGVAVQMRIGINTGEVLVGAMRTGGDPTVMGDVVNTASRLESLAGPGEVIVGAATYAATRDTIAFEALGLLSIRGRDEPVEAYRAMRALAPPGRRRQRGRTALVGRDAEVGALRHIVKLVLARRRSQLVLLFGDAGVGKSRLAQHIGDLATEEFGARTLVGHCVPYGDANAFGPVAEILREVCGIELLADAGDARLRVVETVMATLGVTTDTNEVDRLVEGLMFVVDGSSRPGVDPIRARDESIRSCLAFFEAIAAQGPLVLGLADLHWADDAVLELCERLLDRMHTLPLLVLATARPGFEHPWVSESSRHNALVMHLEPLDRAATAELVQLLFDGCADQQTVNTLLDRSGGNPFFVEELVAYVQESSESPDGATRFEGLVHDLPATLHGLVSARLDALEPAERSLLEDCAVVGGNGPVAVAYALAGREDAPRLMERLTQRDLVTIEGDDEFHFKSELIREIAYGTLTKAERARRHALVAPILAQRGEPLAGQVADHLATAAELVEEVGAVRDIPDDIREQAIIALGRAAHRAEEIEAWNTSGRYHDRALGLLPADAGSARWPALLGRANSRIAARQLRDAEDDVLIVLEEAREADDLRHEAAALTLLGDLYAADNDYDRAEAILSEAVQKWREVGDVSGVANALRSLGMSYLFRGEHNRADALISEALASYQSNGDRKGEAWALQNLAWISFSEGDAGSAEARLHASAELFGELGDWGGLGWAFGLLAYVRYMQGRLDEAAELGEQIAVEGLESGNRWASGMMGVLLASVALWRGRAEEAVREGREAVELFAEIGDTWGETTASGPVVRALAELGRRSEAESALTRMYQIAQTLPSKGTSNIPSIVEGCILLQYGHADEAARVLQPIHDTADDMSSAEIISAFGLMFLQTGRVDEAIAILEPEYAAAQYDGAALSLGNRLALAYAAAQRSEDALRVVAELHERPGGTFHDRLLTLWAEAAALVQTGGDARATVDAALAIATTTDAPLEHALAQLIRGHVLAAIGAPEAAEVQADARRQLDVLGITGAGWSNVFDRALA